MLPHQPVDVKVSNLTKRGKTRKTKPYTTAQTSNFSKEITEYCRKLLAGKSKIDTLVARNRASQKIKYDTYAP